MLQEFRDFINKGNVIDLAVAVVLGSAFKPIIDAIVQRVLMPLIGMAVGQPNFDQLVTFACDADGDPTSGIIDGTGAVCAGSLGVVLTEVVAFLLVALALFLVVRAYNRAQEAAARRAEAEPDPEPEAEPEPTEEVLLLREIRDGLTSRTDGG